MDKVVDIFETIWDVIHLFLDHQSTLHQLQ